MHRRYLFLDFDGVLNSRKFVNTYLYQFREPTEQRYVVDEHINPELVAKVNTIVTKADVEVVISSAWRKSFTKERLQDMLRRRGFIGHIVDCTPIMRCDRGYEIQAWMDQHGVTKDQVVILDDNTDMAHLLDRLVQTSFDTGIQDGQVEEAIRMFNDING